MAPPTDGGFAHCARRCARCKEASIRSNGNPDAAAAPRITSDRSGHEIEHGVSTRERLPRTALATKRAGKRGAHSNRGDTVHVLSRKLARGGRSLGRRTLTRDKLLSGEAPRTGVGRKQQVGPAARRSTSRQRRARMRRLAAVEVQTSPDGSIPTTLSRTASYRHGSSDGCSYSS